jgi:hypothetical protein
VGPSSPAPDDLARHVEPARDLGVVHALRGVEDELGPLDLAVRARIAGGAVLELGALLVGQLELVAALARNRESAP